MPRALFLSAVVLFVCAGCGKDKLTNTLPPGERVDTYTQQAASKIDVLWVVDDSGSMAPRQENLARNLSSFMTEFTRNSVDYRIAVTTTDIFIEAGRFVGSPAVLTPKTPNVLAAFASAVKVGTDGSPYEAGMQGGLLAIEKQQATNAQAVSTCQAKCPANDGTCRGACTTDDANFTFLRPDAYLYVIFISDEEDESAGDVRYYYRYFETAKGVGNDAMVTTAAIIGPANNTCSAGVGARYQQLSTLTGGEVGSICDAEFAAALKKLASNAVGLKRKFALQAKPNVSTLTVSLKYPCNVAADVVLPCASVDRTACADAAVDAVNLVCTPVQGGDDGWAYEADTNLVYFSGASVPGLNAEVDLQYYEEGKGP
jgi:hypothetical protein